MKEEKSNLKQDWMETMNKILQLLNIIMKNYLFSKISIILLPKFYKASL